MDPAWFEGTLDSATARTTRDGDCRVRTFDASVDRLDTADGRPLEIDRPDHDVVTVPVGAGETHRLVVE